MCSSLRIFIILLLSLLLIVTSSSKAAMVNAGDIKIQHRMDVDSSSARSIAKLDSTYLNLGVFYRNLGNFNASTESFYKGLSWSIKMGLDSLKARYLTNIGINNSRLGNLTKSLKFYNQALDIYKDLNDTLRTAYLLNNLSLIYRKQKEFDKAFDFYNQSVEIKRERGLSGSKLNQNNLAFIYLDLKDYDQALYYHQKALKFLIEEEKPYNEARTYNYIANVFLLKNSYDSALDYYYQGFRLGKELNALETVHSAARGLSKTFKNLKLIDSAYFYFEVSDIYKDSISHKKDVKLISEIEAVYNLQFLKDKNDLKNAKIQLDTQRQNLITTVISFVSIILIGIALYAYSIQKRKMKSTQMELKKNELIHRQTIIHLLKEREVKSMKSFILGQEQERDRVARDLHDGIGGTLASLKIGLQRILVDSDQEKILSLTKRLDRACNEVRSVAHNLAPPKFLSTHFTGVLSSFISDLQKSDLTINADFQCPEELNTLDEKYQIEIYRIMQEIVTNVIKHASAKVVDLQLLKIDELINLTVEDDGRGFDFNLKTSGNGLSNIVSRVNLLNGRFNIDSRKGRGTIVNIDFPIKSIVA